jgi:hypothetical protein
LSGELRVGTHAAALNSFAPQGYLAAPRAISRAAKLVNLTDGQREALRPVELF